MGLVRVAAFPLAVLGVHVQGLFVSCIYVGSGDPVRVLHLLHTMNTLDTLEAFIAETYVQLATTKLCATLLAAATQLFSTAMTLLLYY